MDGLLTNPFIWNHIHLQSHLIKTYRFMVGLRWERRLKTCPYDRLTIIPKEAVIRWINLRLNWQSEINSTCLPLHHHFHHTSGGGRVNDGGSIGPFSPAWEYRANAYETQPLKPSLVESHGSARCYRNSSCWRFLHSLGWNRHAIPRLWWTLRFMKSLLMGACNWAPMKGRDFICIWMDDLS